MSETCLSLDTIKLNLFASEILVFTPKGEIKTMPANSTALDFAFSIHSFLGSHCIGAKVNHRLVPLNYRLKSGDQVEILTSRSQHVQREWIDFANTAKAKGKIQAILRRTDREHQREGEQLLKDFLTAKEIEPSTPNVEKLVQLHGYASREELLLAIGEKKVVLDENDVNCLRGKTASSGWRRYIPFIGSRTSSHVSSVAKAFVKGIDRKKTLMLDEETLEQCHLAECCHPIPGDDTLGYIDERNNLIIHKRNCEVANRLKSSYGNRIIATKWDTHKVHFFTCTIYIKGIDMQGMLCQIADVIHTQLNFEITRISLETKDGIFEGTLVIRLHDTDDVRDVCNALKRVQNVIKAVRVN